MSTFGQLIDKAKDKDKPKITVVMKWTLEKTKEDTITPEIIKKVKNKLKALVSATPDNSWEVASIAGWADKYQTFINNATKNGGKRKRRKRTRKRTRKRRRKKQKGGVLLLGAYAAYKFFTKKNKKKRRRKTKKR